RPPHRPRRFGVKLNPETQVVATLGSKEGFANMAQAITAPGDVILVPSPTYPIHEFGFIISGAAIRHIPVVGPAAGGGSAQFTGADAESAFLRGIERAVKHSIPKPLAVVLSYPSNPTAMTVGLDFYTEVVQLAKKLDLIILSDLAYAEIYFQGPPPPSVLQVPGALDLTVEFTSLSKTYAMPGWRMGFAVGNERLIGALARVKSYLDYGAFTPVQVAATAALNGPQACVEEIRATYKSRRDCLVESFARAGWQVTAPPASMFAWAPIPQPYREVGSVEFSKLLVEKADIAVAPGLGFGAYGEGFVRMRWGQKGPRTRKAARNVKRSLARSVHDSLHNVIPIAREASR